MRREVESERRDLRIIVRSTSENDIMRVLSLLLCCACALTPARGQDQPPRTAPAPPGVLIDVGARKLHAIVVGEGSPAVVMISGMGDFAVDWALVQPQIGKFTRAIAYDRAGDGWSDPAPDATGGLLADADDLHALLVHAKVPPPYVLVGHSWGGAIARVYAAKHPADVAGMVLIDSTHGQRERLDGRATGAGPQAVAGGAGAVVTERQADRC
jgi:pimeloyl-ACP methyl ester carboxylesterase